VLACHTCCLTKPKPCRVNERVRSTSRDTFGPQVVKTSLIEALEAVFRVSSVSCKMTSVDVSSEMSKQSQPAVDSIDRIVHGVQQTARQFGDKIGSLSEVPVDTSHDLLKSLFLIEAILFAVKSALLIFFPQHFFTAFFGGEYVKRIMSSFTVAVPAMRHLIQMLGYAHERLLSQHICSS